jgi:hypothetical protein
MEVSGQLNAPAILSPRKKSPVRSVVYVRKVYVMCSIERVKEEHEGHLQATDFAINTTVCSVCEMNANREIVSFRLYE